VWIQNYTGPAMTAKFSKLGKYLGVGTTKNSTVFIYNVSNSFALITSYSAFTTTTIGVYEVDFNPNDTQIVACGTSGTVSTATYNANNTVTLNWANQL
jgi:WD40 repeat protein